MKKTVIILLLLLSILFLYGCSEEKTNNSQADVSVNTSEILTSTTGDDKQMQVLLKIEVNGQILYADFEDNSSADALKEKLQNGSITLQMSDYGSFEKVGDLPFELPRNDKRITTKPGDVILYQGNKLTIYYDKNTWEFTKVAKIRDADKSLKDILGDGDVTVILSSEPQN